MLLTIMFGVLMMLISLILITMSFFISEKKYFDREKASPFECGFNTISSNRIPFSLRFFIIAIIFLVFDIEIILLLPLSAFIEFSEINYWLTIYMIFMIILLLGTFYEWSYGALMWKY